MRTLLLFAVITARAATYYCDPAKAARKGDGSAERPWRTIEEVIQARLIQLCDQTGQPANPECAGQARRHGPAPVRLAWHSPHSRRLTTSQPITIAAAPGPDAAGGLGRDR